MRVNLGTVDVRLPARWGVALRDDPDAEQPASHSDIYAYLHAYIQAALDEAGHEAIREGKARNHFE